MTLQERMDSMFELFGLRNATFMSSNERILFLLEAVSRLSKLVRKKEQNKEVLAQALASIFARTCTFAETFHKLPIVTALCEKYPVNWCAYCQNFPCICTAHYRPDITIAAVSDTQMSWGVNDWCAGLHRIYGSANQALGVPGAISRLYEEVGELIVALLIHVRGENPVEAVRQYMSREFADVFAWIFSLSRLLEVNLDAMLSKQYDGPCHRCKLRPCNCPPYFRVSSRARMGSAVGTTMLA